MSEEKKKVKDTEKEQKNENPADNKVSDNKNTSEAVSEDNKEALADSEIVDIEKIESENKKEAESKPKTVADKQKSAKQDKSSVEFLMSKKKKKKIRNLIILGVIVLGCLFLYLRIKKSVDTAKMLLEAAGAARTETAEVEKKTLSKSVSATGQLLSVDSRTITRVLSTPSEIIEVNASVGDYVNEGDVLVRFSTENVDKSISQTKEDISTQRQQDAIDADDAERNYLNSYKSVAFSIQESAERVDRALESLHEACDAYGDAKRDLQNAKDEGKDEQTISSLEAKVASAYQSQKTAQQNYDDAVEAQAKAISEGQSQSLSNADSQYKKSQINANSNLKTLQRRLEGYEDSLADYVVTATISGIVTAINVEEGNSFQNGSVLTIQDLSNFEAEVLVDEYDVPSVRSAFVKANDRGEDLPVVIKTEATEDAEFKGHVVSIDPTSTATASTASSSGSGSSAVASSSSPQFKVKILFDEVDDAFMVGMTAKVSIIVEQSPEDSLCVPYNAIEENSDGELFVKVVDNPEKLQKNKDGIVVEKDGKNGDRANAAMDFANNMQSLAQDINGAKSTEEAKKKIEESKPQTHDVKVKKIFDTDYYTAVVPVNAGELKAGDIVAINTDKYSGSNDMMNMMMGGPGF